MFQYDSKNAETAWPDAQYPAVLLSATDGVSKSSGKEMQTWVFEVFDNKLDRKQQITEYVTEASLFKVRQLASALNKAQDFKDNRFHPEDHCGAGVMVELKTEQQDGYDDRNRINRISARPPGNLPAAAPQRKQTPMQRTLDPVGVTTDTTLTDESIPF